MRRGRAASSHKETPSKGLKCCRRVTRVWPRLSTFDSDIRGARVFPHVIRGVTEVPPRVSLIHLQNGQMGRVILTAHLIVPPTANVFMVFGPCDFNRGRAGHVTLQLNAIIHRHLQWRQLPVKDWRVSGCCGATEQEKTFRWSHTLPAHCCSIST